ncbi:MAG: type II toxin-antitoxin system PemK/MazF family toxin [Bacteroidota bacterium]
MLIKKYDIWIADLSPRIGTEPGKKRPVLVIQTDLLNNISHPSTIICPITTRVKKKVDILRVHIKKGTAQLSRDCDIMINQLRAIDNRRLVRKLGTLPHIQTEKVRENLRILLDLE